MNGPDYPQDERAGTPSKVPSLIHDYRAQRDAWREQARNLARMREEVLSAADDEARGIVATARADIRSILLKARRDLLVLAAQVRAASRLGDGADAPDVPFLPSGDLGQAENTLTSARNDIRRVLDESRPELEGLVAEGEALRSALRQQGPTGPTRIQHHRGIPGAPVQHASAGQLNDQAVDFEFTTIAAEEPTDFAIRSTRRPVRTLIAAVATLGGIALMGTTWWLFGGSSKPAKPSSTVETSATGAAPGESASRRPANSATTAGRTASETFRGSPIPSPRSALAISLAARRSAWIRITADGRVTAERTFKAGETQLISASRDVSIRAGDAGAVMVSEGGRQAVPLGREGEVVTRRFVADAPRVEAAPRPTTPAPNPRVPVAETVPDRQPRVTTPPLSTTAAASTPSRPTTQVPAPLPPPAPVTTPPAAAVSVPAKPAAAAADRPAIQAAPAANPPSVQDSLINMASRWLDAYYRQDRGMLALISTQVNISDDRGEKERLPRGLEGVRRTLEDVNVQVISSEAMLTAKMTERMDNAAAGQSAQSVAFVSHMWTQRNGSWQLHDVRIVSASSLSRPR